MKTICGGMLLALCLAGAAFAQSAGDCPPAPTNMPNAGYPRVCPDYRVMFKLEAPGAQKVQLEPNVGAAGNGLGSGIFDMFRGADGVWSVTIGPVVPGLHYYHFLVDGLPVGDPGSETFTVSLGRPNTSGLQRAESGIEVPEKGVDFYLPRDVPHGAVEELWYKAKTTGEFRRVFVYVPPGYDKSLTARYPVLYLQHGGTQDVTAWVREGHISSIMDNLLAEKKIVPMLVVMENGYGTMHQSSASETVPYSITAYGAEYGRNRSLFADIMVHDLVPMIEGRYRTMADRSHRAIAGLSRGAGQAMEIGFTNMNIFAYVGSFSEPGGAHSYMGEPATYLNGVFTNPQTINSGLTMFWMGGGTTEFEYDDILHMHQDLEKRGVHHVFYAAPGTAHEWGTWRRQLVDFAPRLFH